MLGMLQTSRSISTGRRKLVDPSKWPQENPKNFFIFFAFFGVCVFSVSSNFDLSGLLPSLEKNHWRLSIENKQFLRFNVTPFEFNRNKVISKNWSKHHMQYLQLSLCPEKFLWGHVVVPPRIYPKNKSFVSFFLFLIWNVVMEWEAIDDSRWSNPLLKPSFIKLVEPWVNE